MCASAEETLVKNEKFALKFASLAFLRGLYNGCSQSRFILNPDWSIFNMSTRSNSTAACSRAQIQTGSLVCFARDKNITGC